MMRKLVARTATVALALAGLLLLSANPADACGGLFCQNDPVDQAGERIVFTVNDDETITSLIEIQYQGSAEDFSWILPIPSAIRAQDLAVPDDGPQVFTDLHAATDVQFIRPDVQDCPSDQSRFEDGVFESAAVEDSSDAVEVFASGEVGPFGFDVIGSADPDALINWLRDNNYRVEPFMEPLMNVYVDEQFAFVAMRLLDGETAESIAPIEITYPGTEPMIPLRLTAVAANPNMPIWVWIFADEQAVPANYEHMAIDTRELTFTRRGGQTDYNTLIPARADALGGRAFITEFAGPASSIDLNNNYIRNRRNRYLTRVYTMISPDEMTVDPIFSFDGTRENVSNIRDASRLKGLYDCERNNASWFSLTGSDAIEPFTSSGLATATTPGRTSNVVVSWLIVGAVIAALGAAAWWFRKASAPPSAEVPPPAAS